MPNRFWQTTTHVSDSSLQVESLNEGRRVTLADLKRRPLGQTRTLIPVVGLGTWGLGGGMGVDRSHDDEATDALRLGLDLGMSLIDTAEMYAAGHSEEIVGRTIQGRKESAFIASKVSPSHFSFDQVLRSAGNSLQRLGLKQIDLYQLHWPNPRIPISETMKAMEKLVQDGLIQHIGVSNFSLKQMEEARQALSREQLVSNQVEYSLLDRSVEVEILPYCKKEKVTVIAYSPLARGRIPKGKGKSFKVLDEIAASLGKTRNQVALNWLLHHESVVAIPKAISQEHIRENATAFDWSLSVKQYDQLSQAFA